MREFADSWALLSLVFLFLAIIVWAYRPGSRKLHDDSASIPFRHDDRPSPATPDKEKRR
jgi:cytochrome c oxidase cbb3-type subunit IV